MQSVNPQKKQININGLNISYKQIGDGDILIVLLHGWGVSSDKYLELARCLSELRITNYELQILIPDLPGFGKSEEPKKNWTLDDYVEFFDKFIEKANRKSGFELVKNLLKNFDLNSLAVGGRTSDIMEVGPPNKFILIGHSFGGRIAIKYAAKHPEKIEKLILTGAAGIKHKLTFKQKTFYILAKTGKKVFSVIKETKLPIGNLVLYSQKILYKLAKEKDYHKASPRMKEIMKNVLAEDLAPYLDKISAYDGSVAGGKIPTLLIWGKEDKTTSLSDGKIMNEKIKNSELVIFDSANHSLPYQKPEEFAMVVVGFVKK